MLHSEFSVITRKENFVFVFSKFIFSGKKDIDVVEIKSVKLKVL